MDGLRQTLFQVIFLWLGIVGMLALARDRPEAEWGPVAVQFGMACSAAIVLVALVGALISHRGRQGPGSGRSTTSRDC